MLTSGGLVGGAGEETILARVGEGIVTTIGSADSHKRVLENPDTATPTVVLPEERAHFLHEGGVVPALAGQERLALPGRQVRRRRERRLHALPPSRFHGQAF